MFTHDEDYEVTVVFDIHDEEQRKREKARPVDVKVKVNKSSPVEK